MATTIDAETQFERLASLLATHSLDTESGRRRHASASEFMLMTLQDSPCVAFKHCNTRNYLHVRTTPDGDVLDVPRLDRTFQRGTFDVA